MPILDKNDSEMGELAPGVRRIEIVSGELGADSLTVSDVTLEPGAKAPTHTHPTEEAMVILDGELDAVLGDEVITVTPGKTVLAPAGVKHGFVNRSGSSARVYGVFPTGKVERTLVD